MNDKNHSVIVENLGKDFGSVRALNEVSFAVEAGSYFVLLGPSGGGKTTILRLIGGFERPTRGRVLLHGSDVTHWPPNQRSSSMVFQSYALFPHMSVERNVGYGLRLRKLPRSDVRERVEEMLKIVGLVGLNRRMPHELSGGQQQRVQLARSLVLDSKILLLDEPLASLDANLRKEMCLELKHIQEQIGITFIHVTHNQEEAMTIADRIAVIAEGDLIEADTPKGIYQSPRSSFTADFIGENNLLRGQVQSVAGDRVVVDMGSGNVELNRRDMDVSVGQDIVMSIRSEKLTLTSAAPADDGKQYLAATYVEQVYLGSMTNYIVRTHDGSQVIVRQVSGLMDQEHSEGAPLYINWNQQDGLLHIA